MLNKTVCVKSLIFSLCLSIAGGACFAEEPADSDIKAAKTAIKTLSQGLQGELKMAMKSGGPVLALAVCNTQAMPITHRASFDSGMQVSRVSLAYRNPANAPNDWQTSVLEDFEEQKMAGAGFDSLEWSETIDTEHERIFRFMKAIPTGSVCLQCHGTELSPDVSAALSSLYPGDRATGFREGDMRGAFVVTKKITDG